MNENAITDLVATLEDFADLKAAKMRFDELYEQRKQEELGKVKHAAEQIDCSVVVNGHAKPKRGRRPKPHEDK